MGEITAIVIDDDRDTVESMSDWIGSKGIKVVGKGYDGKEAVDINQNHSPDIVLIDLMMPKNDGFYAAEHIRSAEPNSKIIKVTANTADETSKRLENLDLDHVFKPYDIDDIMSHIGKQLGLACTGNTPFWRQ